VINSQSMRYVVVFSSRLTTAGKVFLYVPVKWGF